MLSKNSISFALVALAAIVLATFGQVSAANTSGLIFIDSPTRGFLRDVQVEEAPPLALSQDTISVLLSSFLGLAPSTIVTPQAAQQVDDLSIPDIFYKPAVVLSINLAGVGPEEGSSLLTSSSGMLREVDASAFEIMQGMDSVFARMPGTVQHFPLDFNGMQGCDTVCVEDALSSAASRMGGSYQASVGSSGTIGGVLILKNTGSDEDVTFDLNNEAERVFAMEVAALQKRSTDAVANAKVSSLEGPSAMLMDSTLAGPQMLRDSYGPESPQFRAAVSSLALLTSSIIGDLCECHNGKVLGQVALLGDVQPQQPIMQWRSDIQPLRAARMLQEDSKAEVPAPVNQDPAAAGKQWSKTALTWTSFWVLLFFTWFSIISLCTMPFKQDSLLYGSNKSE